MRRRRFMIFLTLVALALVAFGGLAQGAPAPNDNAADAAKEAVAKRYEEKAAKVKEKQENQITHADREDAAVRMAEEGFELETAETAAMAAPGDAPRYFSHPNYANSPLPTVETVEGTVVSVGNELIARQFPTDTSPEVLVVHQTPLPDGLLQSFEAFNQPGSEGYSFWAYVLRPTGTSDEYEVIFASQYTVPTADNLDGEVETYPVPNVAVLAGDLIGFHGQGVPYDNSAGGDIVSYPVSAPAQGDTVALGSTDYPIFTTDRVYSFSATVLDMTQAETTISGGIRKFVDELPLPGLPGSAGTDTLGQYLPIAVPDTTTYEGADYYEIGLVQYREQMHSDLPPTLLRGYVQLSTSAVPGEQVPLSNDLLGGGSQWTGHLGVTEPHYMGPIINATKDRPVRIKFVNLLPTGADGNLFIPVDTTVMGSGMGPDGMIMEEDDPQNPAAGTLPKPQYAYKENRAIIHLHGGISPWISDGTPHQWITPAGEETPYPEGVSVRPVPDMEDPGDPDDGVMTFYYTNQQSARLMFYHDHAWGITRLNVYAGMAAPYLITDEMEQHLVDTGTIPGAEDTIPLVVQDKTFVPDMTQLAMQDETWDMNRWGGEGNLWLPHVYSPAQNPWDVEGVNAFGRWVYGPWFWPPTLGIDYGPIDNPYYDPEADTEAGWTEPPEMPGTPFNSMGMESFMDTPVVNGTAYPTTTVEPKAYRLRILNAANDRFFNLSLYEADPTQPSLDPDIGLTEVALNPDEVAAALEDPYVVFPTPDETLSPKGPDWIQIGTEGGFLPAPVVIPAQPTTWVTDPTVFNAGNVDGHSLLIAPAERADVIVDFSQYAGKTLILYNDAPAAFPARDPRYDYYTGSAYLTAEGGVPPVLPGYGPNTRTFMQIKVADATPADPFNLPSLEEAFKAKSLGGSGVFENGQKPIIVGQGEYNTAYGTSFKFNPPGNGTAQIYDTSLTFDTLSGETLTMPLKPKQIQDEMGEAFEREYGRMSGFLGVETPDAQAGLQNMILYGFTSPPTEVLAGIDYPGLAEGVKVDPIASTDDGTQIWKFTHNGVDTHPIHFHLYDVQLLNRVGWDGIIRKPDPNELGWKDTVRISPLEDTIVAVRPILPEVPWDLPNSIRLLDPSMPEGVMLEDTTAREAAGLPIMGFNPDGEPIDIVNHYVNFGYEYVLHCHILSHEEMDMMRPQAVGAAPEAPSGVAWEAVGNGANRVNRVSWIDESLNETAFVVERSLAGADTWTVIAVVESLVGPETGSTVTYDDPVGNTKDTYDYQVYAINTVGDTWDYSDPALNEIPPGGGFPTLTLDSRGGVTARVEAPSDLTATAVAKNKKTATVTLNWTDNSSLETGFIIQRSETSNFSLNVVNTTIGADMETFQEEVTAGKTYYYRISAFGVSGSSDWSNTASVMTP